jgi:hypothetical protein
MTAPSWSATYNDPRNAVLGVAVALQVLGDWDEDAGWERHVEYPVRLLAALLQLAQVLFELDKGLVLVVLAGDICAEAAELLQLLLNLLCGCLDVRLDALEVFLVVHLRPCIADDANILGEEVVAVLRGKSACDSVVFMQVPTRPKSAGNYEMSASSIVMLPQYPQSSSSPDHRRHPRRL